MKRFKYLFVTLFVLCIVAVVVFFRYSNRSKPIGHPRDYAAIEKEGTIHVATEYNSIGFYVDGDTISGFHYELIEAFTKAMGLKAKLFPIMSFNDRLEGLSNGTYDIIASDLMATSEWKDSLLLTSPIILSKQVLVQRKSVKGDTLYIKSQLDLAGRTLHVVKGSPSILRIRNLSNEIGDTIYIQEVERYGTEQLMAMVAHGDIDYAVCDESIARASIDSMPQLDIHTAISFTQLYSWAVSKQSPVLLDSLNSWLKDFRQGDQYQRIYKKHYKKR